MKGIRVFSVLVFSIAVGSIGLGGCSDDDDGGGGGNNGGNSEIARATQAACENALDCARQQLEGTGVTLNEDQVCQAYEAYRGAATGLSGACIDDTTDYLNCIADASCDSLDDCESLGTQASDTCGGNSNEPDASSDGSADTSNSNVDSEVQAAADAACNQTIACLEQENPGTPLSPDQVCIAYDSLAQLSAFGGEGCKSAQIAYFDCLADATCGDSEDAQACANLGVSASTSCTPSF